MDGSVGPLLWRCNEKMGFLAPDAASQLLTPAQILLSREC